MKFLKTLLLLILCLYPSFVFVTGCNPAHFVNIKITFRFKFAYWLDDIKTNVINVSLSLSCNYWPKNIKIDKEYSLYLIDICTILFPSSWSQVVQFKPLNSRFLYVFPSIWVYESLWFCPNITNDLKIISASEFLHWLISFFNITSEYN